MSLEFRLDSFEGPLDLLLMLIEKNKVDIYDIPIAMITDQYMEYVSAIREEDLETLSDFLVMASTLLYIKSRMLLPKEEDENGEEIDPRTELVERLIEYQEIKMKAGELKGIYEVPEAAFFRAESVPEEVKKYRPPLDYEELLKDVTLEKMQAIFRMVMEKQEEKVDPVRSKFGSIKKDPVRISKKLVHVLDFGKAKKRFSFRELLERQASRTEIVVTFLACLELIKIGQITVSQEDTFEEIDLLWNDECDNAITKEDMEQYD